MATELTTALERNVTDGVLFRVNDLSKRGDLIIPRGYSAANALKSAWLILQETMDRNKQPVLQVCSKESICNSLLDMVIQGLSPSKNQCYFVAYGKQLQLMRSYMGTIAVTKRLSGVKNVFANCIYEDDEFDYEFNLETGVKRITKHNQDFKNINPDKILGAYAVVVREDEENYIEVMNISQIKKAWNQGNAKGNSGAHNNFADEMAKKTVISRACKLFANTSDDSDLLIESFNKSDTEYTDLYSRDTIEMQVKNEIDENANSKLIEFKEIEFPGEGMQNCENQDLGVAAEQSETMKMPEF